MNLNKDIKKWYSDNYKEFQKKVLSNNNDSAMNDAIEKFNELNFPTKKDEEWKYTNISPIIKHNFTPSPLLKNEKNIQSVDKYLIPDLDIHLVVFENGIYNKSLSKIDGLENNVIIGSLNNLSDQENSIISQYKSKVERPNSIFNLLNKAFTHDGILIYIPKNKVVEKPIHILNIASNNEVKTLIQPRNLIIAEENSIANIITEYIGITDEQYFSNIFTEISVDKNANLSFYKLQSESTTAFHLEKTEVYQNDSSIFNHYSLSFGSKIARNDINTLLDGENIECNLYGLYLGNEDQHIDNHTFIDHAKPNSYSNELYKGILDKKSRGVFSGKILVNQIAQKTNAFQSNKTVLLSDDANVDIKPQLEIYADDVKCSHGATVGKLDEEAYFYIRSRGVSSEKARSMLIRAFVDDVVSEIKIEELQKVVNNKIFEHLHRDKF